MITKADRVRLAIASCEMCFEAMGKDMWSPNELVEELWYRVEQQVEAVEAAERRQDENEVHTHLRGILHLLSRIEKEMSG
jgi:hypothetical protein